MYKHAHLQYLSFFFRVDLSDTLGQLTETDSWPDAYGLLLAFCTGMLIINVLTTYLNMFQTCIMVRLIVRQRKTFIFYGRNVYIDIGNGTRKNICLTVRSLKCIFPPDADGSGNGISLSIFFNVFSTRWVNIGFSANRTIESHKNKLIYLQ